MQSKLSNLQLAMHYLGNCTPEEQQIALAFVNKEDQKLEVSLKNNQAPSIAVFLNNLTSTHNARVKQRLVKQNQRKANFPFLS